MDSSHRLDRARHDGEVIVDLAATHLDAPVPNCPDWDGRGLLSHLARVWHMLSVFAEKRPDGFPGRDEFPERVPGGEVEAARVALDRVDRHMRALPPGTPMWGWASSQSSDYFHRRYHLENLVHRVDAEAMAGVTSVIDGDEGADAVDERFGEFAVLSEARPAGSLHVHRTDGAGEWTLRVTDDGVVVTREHAKGDAAARGSGAQLMLAVGGRLPSDELETFGDADLVREWFELAR